MELTTIFVGLFCLVSGIAVGTLWSSGAARRNAFQLFSKGNSKK